MLLYSWLDKNHKHPVELQWFVRRMIYDNGISLSKDWMEIIYIYIHLNFCKFTKNKTQTLPNSFNMISVNVTSRRRGIHDQSLIPFTYTQILTAKA